MTFQKNSQNPFALRFLGGFIGTPFVLQLGTCTLYVTVDILMCIYPLTAACSPLSGVLVSQTGGEASSRGLLRFERDLDLHDFLASIEGDHVAGY
jgi:hypothetical protein